MMIRMKRSLKMIKEMADLNLERAFKAQLQQVRFQFKISNKCNIALEISFPLKNDLLMDNNGRRTIGVASGLHP